MYVQVATQILRPGVQHQREGPHATEPARVSGELIECGGSTVHERVIDPAWVGCGQGVERMGEREDQVAVGHVEQLREPISPPLITSATLTSGAMSIAARVPAPLLSGAAIAAHALAAQSTGAARDNGTPDPLLHTAERVMAHIVCAQVRQHPGQGDAHSAASAFCGGGQGAQ
jgi:hypothetical protein